MPEEIAKIKKQVDQIKGEKESVIKTLQAQRARFHSIQEDEEDALSIEANSATISNLDVSSKILSFIKWNTNLSLIEAEIIANYKAYVDELLDYVETVASNEEQLTEAQEELEAASMEREKLLNRIEELEHRDRELQKIEAKMTKEEQEKIEKPLTEERKKEIEELYRSFKTHTEWMVSMNPKRKVLDTQPERGYMKGLEKKFHRFKGKSNVEIYTAEKKAEKLRKQKNFADSSVKECKSTLAKNSNPHMYIPQDGGDESPDEKETDENFQEE